MRRLCATAGGVLDTLHERACEGAWIAQDATRRAWRWLTRREPWDAPLSALEAVRGCAWEPGADEIPAALLAELNAACSGTEDSTSRTESP